MRKIAMTRYKVAFAAVLVIVAPTVGITQTPTPGSPAAVVAATGGLTEASFKPIAYADLAKWSSSGCSFAVFRGKDNIGLFDTQDPKKTAAFKIDGKLLLVPASKDKDKGSYWFGTVAGQELRLIKGKRDPKFKSDGGSQGGQGSVEWSGPGGKGSIPVRWEEGC